MKERIKSVWLAYAVLVSALSFMTVAVSCSNGPDLTPPGPVSELNLTSEEGKIVITWKDPSDQDLLGIKVYNGISGSARATDLGDGFLVEKGEEYFETTGLENGRTYTFLVSTIDESYNESAVIVAGSAVFKASNSMSESRGVGAKYNWYEYPVDAATGSAATSSSEYVYFGCYPRSILPLESSVIVDEDETVSMGAATYCLGSDGQYYAKVKEFKPPYMSQVMCYSDYTEVKPASEKSFRWFKVEPIKWKVVTGDYNGTGKSLLVAEEIVASGIPYYMDYDERKIKGKTVYPNNYKYSTLRAFLNGTYEDKDKQTKLYLDKGFLQTAFTSSAIRHIPFQEVVNDSESINCKKGKLKRGEKFTCVNTLDKVFLLSQKEVVSSSYGFKSCSASGKGNSRIRMATDFAKATGAFVENNSGYGANWWLRSPYAGDETFACAVGFDGGAEFCNNNVNSCYCGIVPALTYEF